MRKTALGTRRTRLGFGLFLLVVLPGFWAMSALAKPAVVPLRVSSDPYSDPGGQHRTQVEPDTFARGGTMVGTFQVGRAILGGASNIGWVRSRNRGRRFTHGFLPGITKIAGGPYDRVSDPSVAYDAAHRVWLISSLALDGAIPRGVAVIVNRSRHGRHWGRPVTVAAAQGSADFDKNWTRLRQPPLQSLLRALLHAVRRLRGRQPDQDEHLHRWRAHVERPGQHRRQLAGLWRSARRPAQRDGDRSD